MTIELMTALAVFAFAASITPGPNTMLLLASGLNHGFRATIPMMAGISVGVIVMLIAVGLGLGEVFARLPWLYTALKMVSIVYLLWLAWKIATAEPAKPADGMEAARPLTFLEAAGFQWVNPKAWTICVAIATAYTVPNAYLSSLLMASAIFGVVNVPSVIVWAMFGVALRRFLQDPRRVRVFNIAMALALVVSMWPMAVELAYLARTALA